MIGHPVLIQGGKTCFVIPAQTGIQTAHPPAGIYHGPSGSREVEEHGAFLWFPPRVTMAPPSNQESERHGCFPV
jgi:hypothetical protein